MSGLVISPHPLTLEGRQVLRGAELRPGETLAEFLGRHGVDLGAGDWVVTIGGAQVPRLMWTRTRPRHGQLIECRRVAGRQVVMLVAIVFVAWITMGAGLAYFGVAGAAGGAGLATGVAGALGLAAGSFGALLVNAGAMMLGSMLVQKLLAPPRPRMPSFEAQTVSQTYSVSGGRNASRPYEPLGLIFGQLRVVPDYATLPYTTFRAEEQYQYIRLHAGINCGSVEALQIGSTPIETYTDVVVSRSGFPGSTEKLTDWANVDMVAGATLDAPAAPGPWVVRTSSMGTVQMAIDIGASLYSMRDDGGFNRADVTIEVEYRLLPGGAWLPYFGSHSTITISSYATKPRRLTFPLFDLAPGQYEVRCRKLTPNVATTREANAVDWGSLKSFQLDNSDYSKHPQVGISIKAGGQISGALDSVNWLATAAATPVWKGSGWVTEVTSNPGAQILQFARGIFDDDGRLMAGLGLPDSQIDIEGLKVFMLHCADKGYRFDHWFDSMISCGDVLDAIAAAGLGTIGHPNGKLSVLFVDEDQPLEAVVNMANIKKGSFRVDYATRALAEEIEVSWLDRNASFTQRSLRVTAPGISGVPRDTARLAPVGVTTEAGAVLQARFSMAQNLYQRKSITWDMDLEFLTFRRFSRIALSHDLTQWGQGGRLKGVSEAGGVVTLELDEPVKPRTGATSWHVGVRVPGQTAYQVLEVAPVAAETATLTLVDAWPAGLDLPGSTPDNPAHDTLWIFDFKASPGQHLLVTGIEPFNNLSGARITAVPVGDEFWDYVNTGIYVASPAPAATVALAASGVMVTRDRLSLSYDARAQLTVTFEAVGAFDHAQVWAAPTGLPLELLGTTRTVSFSGWTVATAGSYDVEVRPFDALGRQGVVASATVNVAYDEPLVPVPSNTLGIKRNVNDFAGTLNYSEAYIHGISPSGAAVDEPGTILVNGVVASVPNGPLNTNFGPVSGYIVWDSAGSTFPALATQTRPYVLARRFQGQWQYDDNNAATWTPFTPGSTHWVIGTLTSGAADAGNPGSAPGLIAASMWAAAESLDAIAAVADAAWTAQSAADAAQVDADAAQATLAAMRSNSILDAAEKPALIQRWNEIVAEYSPTTTSAGALGITTERSAYDAAYAALSAYLSGLTPGWSDTGSDTPITPSTDQAKWADYYIARGTLKKRISEEAAKRANWNQIAGQLTFRVVTWGNSASSLPSAPNGAGLYRNGSHVPGTARSYALTRIRRSDGAVTFIDNYDVYGNAAAAASMAAALNATGPDHIVVVHSYDEPQANRLSGGLVEAMYRCGASRGVFGSPQFRHRSAYVLVGIPGCGEANGAEAYQGDIDSDPNAWVDLAFQLVAGDLVGVTANYSPRSLRDYGYVGVMDATSDVVLIADGPIAISGNTAVKEGGGSGWNASVRSRDSFTGGAYVSWVNPDPVTYSFGFGLNTDASSNASYDSIDYWLYNYNTNLYVYNNGTDQNGGVPVGTMSPGDVLAVTYDGNTVRYLRNGQVLFSQPGQILTSPLFMDSSFHTVGGKATNIKFGPLTSIKPALDAAATAKGVADAAAINAGSALSTLQTMRSNGYIDAAEKPALIKAWQAISDEVTGIYHQGTSYGLTTLRDAYGSAKDALGAYLTSLSPGWTDTTSDTPITPAVDQAAWAAYYSARQALLNAITDEAAKRAEWAQVSGSGKPLDNAGRVLDLGEGTHFGARNRNDGPNEYPVGRSLQFKQSSAVGLAGADNYLTLETIIQYADVTGGACYQYAYRGTTTWRRWGNRDESTWAGSWVQDLDRNAYTGALDATRNTVTYSGSAPSSPADGDIWIDTSVTPRTVRMRLGGVWQLAGTYVNGTAQLTDDANLGLTALWSGIPGGTGKPADYATRNPIYFQDTDPASSGGVPEGAIWITSTKAWSRNGGGAWVPYVGVGGVGTENIATGAVTSYLSSVSSNTYPIGVNTSLIGVDGIYFTPSINCTVDLTCSFDGLCDAGWEGLTSSFRLFCCPSADLTTTVWGENTRALGGSAVVGPFLRLGTSREQTMAAASFDLAAGTQYWLGLAASGSNPAPGTNIRAWVYRLQVLGLVRKR